MSINLLISIKYEWKITWVKVLEISKKHFKLLLFECHGLILSLYSHKPPLMLRNFSDKEKEV